MALVRKYQNSFTTGAVSPAAYTRVDLQKYAAGCKRIVNGVVLPHGGLTKRPGTRLIDGLPGDARLIPFVYSVEQAYVLVFLDHKMRVCMNGGLVAVPGTETVLEVETPYSLAEVWKLTYAQSADTMFLAHPEHPPRTLVRRDHHIWEFKALEFRPEIDPPQNLTAEASDFKDSTNTYKETKAEYRVSAVNAQEQESEPSEIADADVLSTWPQGARVKLKWDRVPGAVRYEVYRNTRGYWVRLGSADRTEFTDDNIEGDDSKGPKENRDPFNPLSVPGSVQVLRRGEPASGQASTVKIRVASVNSAGVESLPSAEISAAGPREALTLEWEKIPGADYRVYFQEGSGEWESVSVAAESGAVVIKKVAQSSFSGKYANVYEIAVSALTGSGELTETEMSDVETVSVKFTAAWNSSAKIKVEWEKYEDAAKYRVYFRRVSTTSPVHTADPASSGDSAVTSQWKYCEAEDDGDDTNTTMKFQLTKALMESAVAGQPLESRMRFLPSGDTVYEKGAPLETIGSYPGAVGLYQQRLVFGRSDDEPQTVWFSETGAFDSMAVAHPLRDDSAITATVDSRQMNEIRHFVPLKDLLMLTGGAEFKVSAGANSDAVTPTSLRFDLQSYWGCSAVPPVVTGNNVLLVENSGLAVRDLYYQLSEDGYVGNDVTILAEHLMTSPIRDWAYQKNPYSAVWTVLESGKLLSLTYLREQEIWAWSEHESSGGEFRSVASIREGSEDNVYFVVRRNGSYFLEYQVRRSYGDPVEESFFVDCGLEYRGTPIQHVTGLSHLTGRMVSALADGSAVQNLTVAEDGSVDLPFEASVVRVGLPYALLAETLDPEIKSQEGPLTGEKRTVVRAAVTVRETSSLEIGPSEEMLLPLKFPLPERWNAPPVLFSGTIQAALPGLHREEASVVFRHTAPLPATVLSVLTQIGIG
jgi:hypothetical protein